MVTSRDSPPKRWRMAANLRGHATPHALPMFMVGVATVAGAGAAFLFQLISARAIGPNNFGLLAAFLAILNVAAYASSAVQNTVAVGIAETTTPDGRSAPAARRRLSEATILGLVGAGVVVVLAPVLVRVLHATPAVVLLAAAAIPLSFWLSETVGVLQGAGRSVAAVWWTTLSLLARVALILIGLAVGLGVGGVLAAVLLSTGLAAFGAWLPARQIPRAANGVFTRTGLTVLLLSMAFAWLLNSDVIVLRAGAPEVVAGNFASAAILVKAAFMLPSTLSLYLLPRFVRNRENERLMRVGQRVTVAVTVASGLLLTAVFWFGGDLIARLLYTAAYAQSGGLMFKLSLAYLPWITAWSVLIRLIARASRPAVVAVLAAAVLQAVGFLIALPSVTAVIWVQAVIGVGVLVTFFELVRRLDRPSAPAQGSM